MVAIGRPRTCVCGTCAKCKHAVYMRDWYRGQTAEKKRAIVAARDTERVHASDARRQRTERRRAWGRRYNAERARRDPIARAARVAVGNALRDGRLMRRPCAVCGAARVQAHHHRGYAAMVALDVVWLCLDHHREAHGFPSRVAASQAAA